MGNTSGRKIGVPDGNKAQSQTHEMHTECKNNTNKTSNNKLLTPNKDAMEPGMLPPMDAQLSRCMRRRIKRLNKQGLKLYFESPDSIHFACSKFVSSNISPIADNCADYYHYDSKTGSGIAEYNKSIWNRRRRMATTGTIENSILTIIESTTSKQALIEDAHIQEFKMKVNSNAMAQTRRNKKCKTNSIVIYEYNWNYLLYWFIFHCHDTFATYFSFDNLCKLFLVSNHFHRELSKFSNICLAFAGDFVKLDKAITYNSIDIDGWIANGKWSIVDLQTLHDMEGLLKNNNKIQSMIQTMLSTGNVTTLKCKACSNSQDSKKYTIDNDDILSYIITESGQNIHHLDLIFEELPDEQANMKIKQLLSKIPNVKILSISFSDSCAESFTKEDYNKLIQNNENPMQFIKSIFKYNKKITMLTIDNQFNFASGNYNEINIFNSLHKLNYLRYAKIIVGLPVNQYEDDDFCLLYNYKLDEIKTGTCTLSRQCNKLNFLQIVFNNKLIGKTQDLDALSGFDIASGLLYKYEVEDIKKMISQINDIRKTALSVIPSTDCKLELLSWLTMYDDSECNQLTGCNCTINPFEPLLPRWDCDDIYNNKLISSHVFLNVESHNLNNLSRYVQEKIMDNTFRNVNELHLRVSVPCYLFDYRMCEKIFDNVANIMCGDQYKEMENDTQRIPFLSFVCFVFVFLFCVSTLYIICIVVWVLYICLNRFVDGKQRID